MAVINTGIVERTIVGVNESDLFLDSEATSVTTNTGIVERSIVGVHDANFVHPIGDEEITNGGFDTDTDWAKGTGWSISGGKAVADGTQVAGTQLEQNGTYTINKIYKITYTISVTAGTVDVRLKLGGTLVRGAVQSTSGTYTEYLTSTGNTAFAVRGDADFTGSIDNVSVKEMLVNRESTTTNTGIVERAITGSNESELWLDESTSVVNNTGIVERPITGVNESDPMFPDNTISNIVNIAGLISSLLADLEARATTFENEEATREILINLQKC